MSLMCTEFILSKILVSRKRCIKTACSQNKIPCTPIQQYSQPTPFKISRNLLLAYTFTQFIMTHLKCKCGAQCERLGEETKTFPEPEIMRRSAVQAHPLYIT